MSIDESIALVDASFWTIGLRLRYSEPWRHYHTFEHVERMLGLAREAEAAGNDLADPLAIVGAIFWHDAIYDPKAAPRRNEELSAELCASEFGSLADAASVRSAVNLILATADHAATENGFALALFLDLDLSILGASREEFEEYDVAIRREYVHVDEEAFREGRARILEGFLHRQRIFGTDWAADQWESAARENLRLAMDRIRL